MFNNLIGVEKDSSSQLLILESWAGQKHNDHDLLFDKAIIKAKMFHRNTIKLVFTAFTYLKQEQHE